MKGSIFYVLLTMCYVLGACLPKQGIPERNSRPYPTAAQTSAPRHASAEAYIDRFKAISIQEMNIYGIPASITLAQALLESGNGNSYLARVANNHFGIKCASGWKGRSVRQNDDRRGECFRVYDSPEASFRDHSEFLLRPHYAALFKYDKDDYRSWAKGLKKAGYATNPRYAELLIDLIERYELHRFDQPESGYEKIHRAEEVDKEIAVSRGQEALAEEAKPPVKMRIHEVRKGDTLSAISRMYQLSLEELRALNDLGTDQLSVGQLLLVSK